MPTTIACRRLNHFNLVVADHDACVAHLRDTYDAQFLLDVPTPVWHACLIEIGRVILEPFAPPAFLLNARYGQHWLGLEYEADLTQVRAALAERGIRIVHDIGVALHTHPADCHGVAFEFYDGVFHDNPQLGGDRMRSAAWWRDEHPLGLTGAYGYTVVVAELAPARGFFVDLFDAAVIGEGDRPEIAARAFRMAVADGWVELLAPTGSGPIADALADFGEGMRSVVFGTNDVDRARNHLSARGIDALPGSAPGRYAVPPAAAFGVVLEFEGPSARDRE